MANFYINKVILGGRVTADPELKSTSGGVSVTTFSVAVNRKYAGEDKQAQTDFINCVAWRQNAEFVSKYFRKGSSICVVGTIQTRSWTDSHGQKRYATDVVADEVLFVDSKKDSEGNFSMAGDVGAQRGYGAATYVPDAYRTQGSGYEEIDDTLPW